MMNEIQNESVKITIVKNGMLEEELINRVMPVVVVAIRKFFEFPVSVYGMFAYLLRIANMTPNFFCFCHLVVLSFVC